MLNIVCIDDEEDDVELVRLALARAELDATLERVADERGLMHALAGPPDVVLCDYSMPGFSAERALALLQRCPGRAPPVIVVTRAIAEATVVQLLRNGAHDYVPKDKLALLPTVIHRVLAVRAHHREQRRTTEQLAETYTRYRALSARMVDAQERERASIARELHDGLGQLLTGIMIHLHAAGRTPDAAQGAAHRDSALAMADQALQQVKTLSFDLRPAQLGLLGFVPAVRAMLERKLGPPGIRADLQVQGEDPTPEHPSRAVALRVLQQALLNVIRHAQARRVTIRLRLAPGRPLRLTVADDGRGFDVHAVLHGPVNEHNIGLRGMQERAELAGGRLKVCSRPGRGTVLCLRIG
ncbi:histidine kinase [Aquabacterium sp. J223]|uniref:hybrid sensor histidine kinase/response regulator n=1 Tax=Aquabacterium sp. J223 TaxID=2898431 RepID=UPI0021ADC2C8|nr:histidine kinase [Aquabacterium sp. J223]UUX94545.1 histidine kinase [Aquabacterium sp. J223]